MEEYRYDKKELNKIRSAAFEAFVETESGKEFMRAHEIQCKCWRIAGGEKRTLFITYHDTQLNKESLKAHGYSTEAAVSLLFVADKQTKALTPSGWN